MVPISIKELGGWGTRNASVRAERAKKSGDFKYITSNQSTYYMSLLNFLPCQFSLFIFQYPNVNGMPLYALCLHLVAKLCLSMAEVRGLAD